MPEIGDESFRELIYRQYRIIYVVGALLHECLPAQKLKPGFPHHDVRTVRDRDWRRIKIEAFLSLAELECTALVRVDGSLQYQQNTTEVD